MNKLRIATAQFPVSGNIGGNLKYMVGIMEQAKTNDAHVVHFPECCLGGYAGEDFKTWTNYDWKLLKNADDNVRQLARKLGIAAIYGTNALVRTNDVRNRLKYVSKTGECMAYYDKRFCTPVDMQYYKPGRRFATFTLNGFRCGLLICFDVRFPELYRAYKRLRVQMMFHSFYQARTEKKSNHSNIIRASLQAHAATNYLFISGNNSSAYYQMWPSVFILPDGTIGKSCRRHGASLLIHEISSDDKYYDASLMYRESAMSGVLNSTTEGTFKVSKKKKRREPA
jgi:deaminated glutathione amidase